MVLGAFKMNEWLGNAQALGCDGVGKIQEGWKKKMGRDETWRRQIEEISSAEQLEGLLVMETSWHAGRKLL